MEDQPVELIRECSRSNLMINRRACRDEETNVRRNIVTQNVTQAAIADIANRLKSKSTVSVSDLRMLKNGLLDNPQYTQIVLNTQGAVRGLVRELTGQVGNRQCVAADCLCNLSIGDARASATLAKAAGPYLLTALDSLNADLAITCAWTLGNMAGSGARAVSLMTSQGAVAKLAGLMTSPNDDVVDAAVTALAQFAHQMGDDFRQEHVLLILQSLSQKELAKSSLQLLFILSCHRDFNNSMNKDLLVKIIETTLKCMENITENSWQFVYAIRVLANLELNDNIHSLIIEMFSSKEDVLKQILMTNADVVNNSLLWFLGNLYNYSDCGRMESEEPQAQRKTSTNEMDP